MSFLGSTFLLALPLVAVPLVIHLLNRRRRNVVRWGAMQFLREAAARRRRIWRIEDLLLLLLRTAAVLAFILALAQPLLHSGWLGGGGARDVVLVLDTSMSTAQTNSAQTLFEKQLDRARTVLDDLGEGDHVRVLLASSAPRWLVPVGVPMSTDARRSLMAQLDQLEPTLAGTDMLRSIHEAIEAPPADAASARVVTVLTDGMAEGWRADATQAWRGVQETLRDARVPPAVNIVTVADPERATSNLAVLSMVASRELVAAGAPVTLQARIANTGDLDTPSALLHWEQDGRSLGVTTLGPLAAGEETTLSTVHVLERPGVYRLSCRLDFKDDLLPDNRGRFVVQAVESVPILIVDGTPWAPGLKGETGYLMLALGLAEASEAQARRSVFVPEVIDATELSEKALAKYRCVVLADVGRLTEAAAGKLADYVRDGGGVWIILGEQADAAFYNRARPGAHAGLLPLRLAEAVGDARDDENAVLLRPPSAEHPATRFLADLDRLDIDRVKIRRRYRFDVASAPVDLSVLLSTARGEPVAVERMVGRGRVIVQGIPLNLRWSTLPACQAFVVMAHEWLWYLSEPTMTHWNLTVGESFLASEPANGGELEPAELVAPNGLAVEVEPRRRGDQAVYTCVETHEPGDYALRLGRDDGPREVPFCVRGEERESRLGMLDVKSREALSLAGGVRFADEPLAISRSAAKGAPPSPLWSWLLAGLLAVLVLESLLAMKQTWRRTSDTAPVAMGT